jgi:hypothetical protein
MLAAQRMRQPHAPDLVAAMVAQVLQLLVG